MVRTLSLFTAIILSLNISFVKAPEPMTVESYADSCGISVDEFALISSVVEAESNRSTDGDLTGRIYIAVTILNRVNDERFPDTITEVLTQRGQFSTVRGGQSVTDRTEYSDAAVLEAYEWIEQGDAPQVYFFNCRGYFSSRTAVGEYGGNYFSGF